MHFLASGYSSSPSGVVITIMTTLTTLLLAYTARQMRNLGENTRRIMQDMYPPRSESLPDKVDRTAEDVAIIKAVQAREQPGGRPERGRRL